MRGASDGAQPCRGVERCHSGALRTAFVNSAPHGAWALWTSQPGGWRMDSSQSVTRRGSVFIAMPIYGLGKASGPSERTPSLDEMRRTVGRWLAGQPTDVP